MLAVICCEGSVDPADTGILRQSDDWTREAIAAEDGD
jgi:hypothetical protein